MFAIPTLADLVSRARAAFATNLPGVNASAPGNNIGPVAKVIAQSVWDLFGRLDWVYRQLFVSSAAWTTLLRKGADVGLSPRPAASAAGEVAVAWSAPVAIAAGARFQRGDGVVYQTLDPYSTTTSSGSTTLAAQAVTSTAAGDAEAGEMLAIIAGVTGAGAATAVAQIGPGGMAGGRDVEDIEAFRAHLLFRLRFPPHGGAASDYVLWAMRAPGVTRVFVERLWLGPGTVRVFPILDGLREHGVPNAADVQMVRDVLAPVLPASAGVTVASAAAQTIDVVISGLDGADAATRTAVAAALEATFRTRGRVSGADALSPGLPFIASPFVFSKSWIGEAISSAAGEARHVLMQPDADVVIGVGAIPALGVVSFQ